ncbi:MAG: hypothetical protein ACI8PB_003390 [Desulforhopalus sp.]|jgi:uncharacterized protein involved in outer membrane biogenesis
MKPMMKIACWSAAGFICLVIACVIVIKSISNDQYKEWISDAASSATGRQLVFDGDFNVHFGKEITFMAKEIRFANTEQGSRRDMVTANRLLLRVALLPIFKGVLDFVIELDDPDILLETNDDGRGNWVLKDSALEESEPEQESQETAGSFTLPLKPYIRNFEIKNLKFAFKDNVGDKQISVDMDTFKIFVDGGEVPLIVKAAYNDAPVELDGILGRIDDLHSNRLTDISLNGKLNGADLTIKGSIGPLSPKPNAQINLLLRADTVSTLSPYVGITLPDLHGLDISLRAYANKGKLSAEDIKILLNDEALDLNIAGNIADLSHVAGINLTTEIKSEHLDKVLDEIGVKLSVAMPASLSIKGAVTGSLEELSLNSLNAVVKDEGVAVIINGKVTNLLAPSGVAINLAATADSIAKITKFAGTEIPDLGALDMKGQIVSKGQQLRLDSMNIKLGGGELLGAQVDAVVDDLMALIEVPETPENYGAANVAISLKADAASISQLAQVAGVKIPDLGSLQLVGKISSSEQSLRLESLEAIVKQQGMNTRVTAAVADLITFSGINGTAEITIESLSTLATLTDLELPQTGPWALNVTAAAVEAKGATEVVANLTSDGLKAVINANIPEIKDPRNLQASLFMEAESLAVIGEVLGWEMEAEGPIKVTAKAVVQPEEYRVDDFQMTLGDATANADLQYILPQGDQDKPKLVGQMEINEFDLTKIFPANEEEGDSLDNRAEVAEETEETLEVIAESETEAASTGNKKIFSSKPLTTGALQDYEVDLKVNTSNLTLSKNFMVHGSLAVTLTQGVLKLGPLDLKGESGGSGESLIVLDASSPEANLDVKIQFDNFVSPRFGGNLDLDVDLDGHGGTIAAVMGSLNGRFIGALNDYKLNQSPTTKFGSGLFSRLNPVKKDTTILECAIVRFDAKDGMADFTKKIAAQTSEVTWFGSGEINLKTEELDFGIHPQSRNALNSLTDLGLAELIHIGGTLAEPSIGVDPKDIAIKYGKYSAYIATGGLSWLAEKVLENRQSNVDQCELILGVLDKK